jgi:predicted RNA binding protein YcfA (HicA-like mRNA interferase family)
MASISRSALEQLKNKTASDWINALKKDGWIEEDRRGATRGFVKHSMSGAGRKRVVIHFHPKKQYGVRLLKWLLTDTGWNEADLRRLRMIK